MICVDDITAYAREQIQPAARRHGQRWCHLWADTAADVPALHELARRIGLKRAWFQDKRDFPHYDLLPGKRALAVQHGAVPTSLRAWLASKTLRTKEGEIPMNTGEENQGGSTKVETAGGTKVEETNPPQTEEQPPKQSEGTSPGKPE